MQPIAVGPVDEPFDDVERIAVLRGGGMGDLFFALPAITALSRTYPDAHITLLGTPIHRGLLDGRPGPVDEVVVLPYAEGVRPRPASRPASRPADDDADDATEIAAFQERMRARSFDLAVQVHGGGRNSNAFLLELGARHTIGTATDDAPRLERMVPYLYYQHEVLRALEVVGTAGAATTGLSPTLEVTDGDRARAHAVTSELGIERAAPWLALHTGSTDERRKWPASSFAEVAERAAAGGYEVLLLGDASEAAEAGAIAAQVSAGNAGHIHVLAGRLGLDALVGVLAACDVMVGNDSGPRHLAQAVGTPTVGIFWAGNLIMAGPLGRSLDRVHIGWVTRCPVCGIDVTQVGWSARRCAHDFPLTAEVSAEAVYADVVDLTARNPRPRGR